MKVSIEFKSVKRGLVVHFADAAMKRCLYGFLRSLGIQYVDGKSQSWSLVERPEEDSTDLWFSIISSLEIQKTFYHCYFLRLPLIINIGCKTFCKKKKIILFWFFSKNHAK